MHGVSFSQQQNFFDADDFLRAWHTHFETFYASRQLIAHDLFGAASLTVEHVISTAEFFLKTSSQKKHVYLFLEKRIRERIKFGVGYSMGLIRLIHL